MIGKDIDSREISVVIQGPIFYEIDQRTGRTWTQVCADSIRQYLPHAEIILSTWKGADVNGIDYDVCIFNEDPGEVRGNCAINANRQKISTRNGILRASRRYVLKMRSESYLTGREFIDVFGTFTKRSDRYRIMKERVVAMGYANPYTTLRPFYLSDTYFFGLKEDVLYYWDTPLAQPSASAYVAEIYWQVPWWKRPKDNKVGYISCNNEQHYMTGFVDKYLEKNKEKSETLLRLSDWVVANNFIVMDGLNANQIYTLKHPTFHKTDIALDFEDWKLLYRHYCDQSFKLSCKERGRFYIVSFWRQWHILKLFSVYFPNNMSNILHEKNPKLHADLKRIYHKIRRRKVD